MNHLKDSIQKLTNEYHPKNVAIRRYLHQNPELSFQEHQTAKRIEEELTSLGIPVFTGVGGTGVIGLIEGGKPGKTIGIRAELDALPVNETTGVDFASSIPGVMHACGHDIHMANLTGAARVLNDLKADLQGIVLLVYQPGEELLPGGALRIIESEVFRNHKPQVMIGLHILPELSMGKVGFHSGPYMASGDEIYINVKGKGGHAALPHTYNNPIPIASQLIVALQQGVHPNLESDTPSILAFGRFIASGATNVIPDEVKIEGTFRTMDEHWRLQAHQKIKRIVKDVAEGNGASCEVEIRKGYPSVVNNPEYTDLLVQLSSELIGEHNVIDLPVRMTTDDFAYYSQQIPSVYFRVGVKNEGEEPKSLHSGNLLVNDNVLKHSVAITAWLVASLLSK